jgi:hypothetical protein
MNTQINNLDAKLREMLESREAFVKHVNVKELVAYIDYLVSNHRMVMDATKLFSGRYPRKLEDDFINIKNHDAGFEPYLKFRKKLIKSAATREASRPMDALLEANRIFIYIMSELRENMGEYFFNEKVNLFNLQLSHVIILGLLYQSEQLCTYTEYMYTLLVQSAAKQSKSYPRYRLEYLAANSDTIAELVNSLLVKAGSIDYKHIIKNIKINAADFALISDDNTVVAKKLPASVLKNDAMVLTEAGTNGLFIFRLIWEQINTIVDKVHKRRLAQEEWLKAHTAYLIAVLEGKSEDDPETAKLKKVIEKYEEMINKYERQRNKGK